MTRGLAVLILLLAVPAFGEEAWLEPITKTLLA